MAENDGRNLFPTVFRAVRALRPCAIFLENVRGLARPSFQPYFDYILRQLECPSLSPHPHELWHNHHARIRQHQFSVGYEPEYSVVYRLVEAADYGVPQLRQRVIIVATRRDFPQFEFPRPTHSKNQLLRALASKEYWDRHEIKMRKDLVTQANIADENHDVLPWRTVRDALVGLPVAHPCETGAHMNHWRIPGARAYEGHSGSRLDWPSKTIKAGVHGVPGGENTIVDDNGIFRYFTLRESARLQTFPDTYFFSGARIHVTRQIGNAVPCVLAAAVAKPLFSLIERELARRKSGKRCL